MNNPITTAAAINGLMVISASWSQDGINSKIVRQVIELIRCMEAEIAGLKREIARED
jgi:hypothetical protein